MAQQPIELRVSRFIGDGMHEDLALTNFTQEKVKFTLSLEVDFGRGQDVGDRVVWANPRLVKGGSR